MSFSAARRAWLHPVRTILLAFPVALFVSTMASDVTYLMTEEIQWSNFSQWAITGALIFGAPLVLLAAVESLRRRAASGKRSLLIYLTLVASMWVLGLVDAFKHSQDAWSSVGWFGLVLSTVCAALALAAMWIASSGSLVSEKTSERRNVIKGDVA